LAIKARLGPTFEALLLGSHRTTLLEGSCAKLHKSRTNREHVNMLGESLELFAGAGGLGIGLSAAGFKPRVVVEFNKWCCDTLRQNHATLTKDGGWEVIEGDIRRIDFSSFEGKVDLISGGPPCQPFSLGGRHRAYDDTRDICATLETPFRSSWRAKLE
jgi:hypothetical protein